MQRFIIVIACLFVAAGGSFAQKRKTPAKPSTPKPAPVTTVSELPEGEWSGIIRALEAEEWDKSSMLSGNALKKLRFENDKNQLARLRYIYLFSSAGRVAQGKMTATELQNIAQTFVGQAFIMLDRNALTNCQNSLNYVCPVKANKSALRVSATNKAFTTIHSFENVKLLQPFDFTQNNLKNVFVGGTLRQVEVNQKPEKVWIMRLSFENGWVQMVEK
jgi:hypothetical protein